MVISSAVKEKKLDRNRVAQVVRNIGLKPGNKVVGIISAIEPHKDPWTALNMAEDLHKKRQDFSVLHFGGGALVEEIEHDLIKRNMGSYYHLMGHVDGVEDFFSLFDVFVMTSKEEGLGSSVLDAFIYGVPVVSTDAGGLLEVVQGRGGLCSIGDEKCLSRKILQVFDNNPETAYMVEEARRYSGDKCSIDRTIDKYILVYEELSDY